MSKGDLFHKKQPHKINTYPNRMKQAVIVVLDFAQFQEIQTRWNKKTEPITKRRIKLCPQYFFLSHLIQSFHFTRAKLLSLLLLRSRIIFPSVLKAIRDF